jgi:hypothetical protein
MKVNITLSGAALDPGDTIHITKDVDGTHYAFFPAGTSPDTDDPEWYLARVTPDDTIITYPYHPYELNIRVIEKGGS